MSEEENKTPGKEMSEEAEGVSQQEPIELTVNKKTGEIVFKSQTGQIVTAKATVIEEDKEERILTPLTPEQFREGLRRFQGLGLTWTADTPTRIEPAVKGNDSALLSAEFEQFKREYPTLPREVGSIAFHYLTGYEYPAEIVGDVESLREKINIAKEFYLNEEYRAEFFFKHAIKVPYFSDIDWEIVIKTYEKNVRSFANVPYALLSLHLKSPKKELQNQILTVAVNAALADKLLASLGEVKRALEESRKLAGVLCNEREKADSEKEQDAYTNTRENVG